MLHILWMILKFILILLGIILGLLLLVILLVLFCPFRYYASAEKLDEDLKKTKLYVSASWLFHGVWLRLQFQEGVLGTKIHLFGIPVHKILEKKKGTSKSEEKHIEEPELLEMKTEETVCEEATAEPEQPVETLQEEATAEPEKAEETVCEEATAEPEKAEETVQEEAAAEPESTEEAGQEEMQPAEDQTIDFLTKIRNILDLVVGKLRSVSQVGSLGEKISNKLNAVREKVQGILDKVNWWKKFLTHPKVKATIRCVKNAVFKIIKHVIPTRIYGKVTFGSEDPATTGTVLAVLGITMPIHKNSVEVTPVFEGRNVLTGKVQLKGRIYIAVFVAQILKVIINKNVRYTIKYWKHKEES